MTVHTVTLKRTNEHEVKVLVDNVVLSLEDSLKIKNHSPTGFNAGYGGSGPAQAALAIMLKVTSKETALACYQDFKWKYLANAEYLYIGVHFFTFEFPIKQWRQE